MIWFRRYRLPIKKEGFTVNHKRVYHLMKELAIQSIIRKKRRYYSRKASVVQPNRLLATDITYISWMDKIYFLSAIQALFKNEIVNWKVSKRNDLQLVMDTVDELLRERDVQRAISDQGFQYTSQQYNKRLEKIEH